VNQRLILAAALALATPAAFCQAPATPPASPATNLDAGPQQGPPSKRHFEMRVERDGQEQGPRQMFAERNEEFGPGGGPGGMREHHEMGMRHEGGEHGEWWKNPELAKRIALTPEQTKKLDELSFQGHLNMIHLHAALEEQELMMKPIMESPTVDEKKAELQIDKVAESRALLEKAAAKQKLAMRAVLTADQWSKLHEHHPMGGPQGPGGMMRHHQGGPDGGPEHAEVPPMDSPAPPPAE
jgi:Spy/CpxP family protein refolding chaperone